MRVFKSKSFGRFARKESIADDALSDAVRRAELGQIDANLGGAVIKQRVARVGAGKSGGYRTVIFFKLGFRAFFMYGFAKSQTANIDSRELATFKQAAAYYLALTDREINRLLVTGDLTEVHSPETTS